MDSNKPSNGLSEKIYLLFITILGGICVFYFVKGVTELEQKDQLLIIMHPKMQKIPSGQFRFRCNQQFNTCPTGESLSKVNVKAFRIGIYEVTVEQYQAVKEMGELRSSHMATSSESFHPKRNINWKQTIGYIDNLNHFLKPEIPYRLPTEQEWEYAARAGSKFKYHWGDESPVCDRGATNGSNTFNCNNEPYLTMPVGSFKANKFGLFDVHGNVSEWTADCALFTKEGDCNKRIFKGGSFSLMLMLTVSSFRHQQNEKEQSNDLGFRLAQDLP